jgi:hypothetical protein
MKTHAKRLAMGMLLGLVAVTCLAAVPASSTRNDYTGNGSTTAFAFTFRADASSWVEVYLGTVKQGGGYTVTRSVNQASSPGGTVTFAVAPANSVLVRIQRTKPLSQDSTWPAWGPFRAAALEGALDSLAMSDQQLQRGIDDINATIATGISGPSGPQGPAGSVSAAYGFSLTGGDLAASGAGLQRFTKSNGNLLIGTSDATHNVFFQTAGVTRFTMDALSGTLTSNGTATITGVPSPGMTSDVATKGYVDGAPLGARAWFMATAAAAGSFTYQKVYNVATITWSGNTASGSFTTALPAVPCAIVCAGAVSTVSGTPSIFYGTCPSTSTFSIVQYATTANATPLNFTGTAGPVLSCAVYAGP